MTTDTTPAARLTFGDNDTLPTGATFAWGARLIITADGHVDLPPGRTDRFGEVGDLLADLLFQMQQTSLFLR